MFAGLDMVVKREMDEAKGEVRVMTVHGAKGLEAPIVIMPETTVTRRPGGSPLLPTEEAGSCGRRQPGRTATPPGPRATGAIDVRTRRAKDCSMWP